MGYTAPGSYRNDFMGIFARYAAPLRCMRQKKAAAIFPYTHHCFRQSGIPRQKVRLQEMLQEIRIMVGPGPHTAAKGPKKSKMEQVTCPAPVPPASFGKIIRNNGCLSQKNTIWFGCNQ